MELSPGMSVALVLSPTGSSTFSYGLLKDIDLTGIKQINVMASGVKPLMSGGALELRLDDKGSEPVASADVSVSFVPNLDMNGISLDVSQIEGIHDLYFGTPAVGDTSSGGMVFAFVRFEFIHE